MTIQIGGHIWVCICYRGLGVKWQSNYESIPLNRELHFIAHVKGYSNYIVISNSTDIHVQTFTHI